QFAGAVCWLPGDRLSRTKPKSYRRHPMYVIVRRAPEATAPAALPPRRARHTRSLPVDEPFRSAYPYGRESQARAATAPAHRREHRNGIPKSGTPSLASIRILPYALLQPTPALTRAGP